MAMNTAYAASEPSRTEIDTLQEATIVEFGALWCGHCAAAQALLTSALAQHPQIRHIKIEDGPGRRLGRSFKVKLWPTLILLRQGMELARVVRPSGAAEIRDLLRG